MIEYILLAAMAAVVVLLMVLRTNTAVCFLALCAGSILLSSSGDNAGLVVTSLTSGMSASAMITKITLLLVPFTVCAVLLRGQVHKSLLPLAFLPAVCSALLGALLIEPLLTDGTRGALVTTETWTLLTQYQEAIVGIGLVVSVVVIALTIKRPHEKHKKGHH